MDRRSLKFKHMSTNTLKLMFTMLMNQNLLRYVRYLGNYNPLDKNAPDVDFMEVRENNFVLTKFDPEILKESKVRLFLNPSRGRFGVEVTADDMYEINIIVPNEFWLIGDTSELRAYSIAHEISNCLDQKHIAGIGRVEIVGWDSYSIKEKYSGVTLALKVTNTTMNSGVN